MMLSTLRLKLTTPTPERPAAFAGEFHSLPTNAQKHMILVPTTLRFNARHLLPNAHHHTMQRTKPFPATSKTIRANASSHSANVPRIQANASGHSRGWRATFLNNGIWGISEKSRLTWCVGLIAYGVGLVFCPSSQAATNTLKPGTNLSWGVSGNWSLGTTPAATDALLLDGSSATTSGLASSPSVQTLSFNTGSNAITINSTTTTATGGRTLTLNGGTNALGNTDLLDLSSTTNGSVTIGGTTSTGLITIAFGVSGSINVENANATLTLGSQSIVSGSSKSLTKSGAGTLILGGANTYSGGTFLSAGGLNISGSGTLGSTSGTLNVSGGTLNLGTTTQTTGAATISGGTIQNGTLTSTSYTATNAGSATVSAILAGSGSLSMSGAGTLTLSGANTYVGGTILSSGTLGLGSSSVGTVTSGPIGTGTLTLTGGTLQASGGDRSISNSVAINSSAGATVSGSNNLTFSGAFTVTSNSSSLTNSLNAGKGLTLSGDVFLSNSSGTGRSLTIDGNGETNISGVIANFNGSGASGNVIKSGAGTLMLSNQANTYTGTTTISGGILSVTRLADAGSTSSIGNRGDAGATGLVIDSGTLKFIGTTGNGSTNRRFTVGVGGATIDASSSDNTALVFTNTGALGASGTGDRTLTLQGSTSAAAQNSISSVIADPSGGKTAVTKSGSNTWVLSGSNTYTGVTTVNQGTLLLGKNNTLQTGTSDSTRTAVALAGGNLSTGGFSQGSTGTPTTLGALTLSGNSSITLGSIAGIETLAFSDLATDLSTFTGVLTIYNWEGTRGSASGGDNIFFANLAGANTTDTFTNIQFNIGGTLYGSRFTTVTNGFELYADTIAVPEPSTWIGGGVIFGLAAWSQRKRFARQEA